MYVNFFLKYYLKLFFFGLFCHSYVNTIYVYISILHFVPNHAYYYLEYPLSSVLCFSEPYNITYFTIRKKQICKLNFAHVSFWIKKNPSNLYNVITFNFLDLLWIDYLVFQRKYPCLFNKNNYFYNVSLHFITSSGFLICTYYLFLL